LDSPTEISWHIASNRRAIDMAPRHFSWTVRLEVVHRLE
jgi:hypothetical protein